jgi:hypothetical protein
MRTEEIRRTASWSGSRAPVCREGAQFHNASAARSAPEIYAILFLTIRGFEQIHLLLNGFIWTLLRSGSSSRYRGAERDCKRLIRPRGDACGVDACRHQSRPVGSGNLGAQLDRDGFGIVADLFGEDAAVPEAVEIAATGPSTSRLLPPWSSSNETMQRLVDVAEPVPKALQERQLVLVLGARSRMSLRMAVTTHLSAVGQGIGSDGRPIALNIDGSARRPGSALDRPSQPGRASGHADLAGRSQLWSHGAIAAMLFEAPPATEMRQGRSLGAPTSAVNEIRNLRN